MTVREVAEMADIRNVPRDAQALRLTYLESRLRLENDKGDNSYGREPDTAATAHPTLYRDGTLSHSRLAGRAVPMAARRIGVRRLGGGSVKTLSRTA